MNGVQCVVFSKLVNSEGFNVRYVRNGYLDYYDTEETDLSNVLRQFIDFIGDWSGYYGN